MIKLITNIILVILISACSSSVDIDYSSYSNFACMKLNKPSFVYKGWCANFYVPSDCLGIQSFPVKAFDKENNVLLSMNDYQENKPFWDKILFTKTLFSGDRKIIDAVAMDSHLEIVQIVKKQWGTDGYFWDIKARITDGPMAGEIVALPTYRYHLGEAWVNRAGTDELKFNKDFIQQCYE